MVLIVKDTCTFKRIVFLLAASFCVFISLFEGDKFHIFPILNVQFQPTFFSETIIVQSLIILRLQTRVNLRVHYSPHRPAAGPLAPTPRYARVPTGHDTVWRIRRLGGVIIRHRDRIDLSVWQTVRVGQCQYILGASIYVCTVL